MSRTRASRNASSASVSKPAASVKKTKRTKPATPSPPSPPPSPSDDDDSSDSDSDDEAVVSAINLAAGAVKKKLTETAPPTTSNELTFLIPGYTAPMSLTSNSKTPELYIKYDKKGKSGGKNPSGAVASFNSQPTGKSTSAILPPPTSHIMKASIKKKNKEKTNSGDAWFNMPSYNSSSNNSSYRQQRNAELLKDDLKVIKMRNYLDPKKFYKSNDEFSPFAQRGTIIESGSEFFSSRLTKAERRQTLLDEVMSDRKTRNYVKRKFGDVQEKAASGGKKHWKMMQKKKKNKTSPMTGNIFSGSRKKFS